MGKAISYVGLDLQQIHLYYHNGFDEMRSSRVHFSLFHWMPEAWRPEARNSDVEEDRFEI